MLVFCNAGTGVGVSSQHSLSDFIKSFRNFKKLFRFQSIIVKECTTITIVTDLFYYKKKTQESSSLITELTSDNFTPLLFNRNITHTILKMGKHFHVLFKSEMIYETNTFVMSSTTMGS